MMSTTTILDEQVQVGTTSGLQTWSVDGSHTQAHFTVRHMMVSNVRGMFSKVKGELAFDPERPEKSIISVTIETASIDTRDAGRDTHLKSADFFDVEKYPEMTFLSSKFEKVSEDEYKVHGELTLHGITKPVTLSVEGLGEEMKDPWGNTKIGAVAKTKINRKDFDLGWNAVLEAGGVVVGEEVKIEIDAEFAKN